MESPIPFSEYKPPRFPIEALTGVLRPYVEELAQELQVPPDMVAMLVLAVIAAAVAKRYVIQVRPSWIEPVNLYVIVALEPGNLKSPTLSRVIAPLRAFEVREAKRLAGDIAAQASRRRIKEQEVTRLEKRAAQAADPAEQNQLLAAAEEAARELQAMKTLVVPRLLVDDVTPERLVSLLAEHGGRLALMSAEGGFFETIAGRYSSGIPNFDVVLKAHGGEDVLADRVGRPPVFVPAATLTMALAIQPDVVRDLATKPGFRGRGLLARPLYAMPESWVGSRDLDAPPMNEQIQLEYDQLIEALLQLSPALDADGAPVPHVLDLEPKAAALRLAFSAEIEPRLGKDGDLGPISDWGGKLSGAVARIAALLHLAAYAHAGAPWSVPVSAETMASAIAIGHYLIGHAKEAYCQMGVADPLLADARYLVDFLEQWRRPCFSRRDLHQENRSRFRKMEQLVPTLKLLVEHRYIFEMPVVAQTGPGRPPSPMFETNPVLLGGVAVALGADPDLDFEHSEDCEEDLVF